MSTIPATMCAAVLRTVGQIAIQRRPVPQPSPHEVLVRVHAVGTCGSDVHYYEHGRIGDFVVSEPLVLGHEPSGVVVDTGPAATRHQIGQRVALEPGVPCSMCAQCKRGRYNLCPEMRFFGTPPIDGAFCDYVVLREDFAHAVPDQLSDDAAALLEPLSVGVWACRKGRVGPGCRVLVAGAGPIGLIATQTAQAFGAAEIVVTDVRPQRLAVAERLGATATIDVSTNALADAGYEPDVLLECSGVPSAATEAIRVVARAGTVVLVGMGGDELTLPLAHVQGREIEVTGTFRYANTWPTAISLVADGDVDLDRLVTHRFGLDQVGDALTSGPTDPSLIKAMVYPASGEDTV